MMMQPEGSLGELLGKQVVLDTAGPVVYIGLLERIESDCYWLSDADVHNQHEGYAPKELYVLEVKLHGVRANRKRVAVMRSEVISLSLLDDVVG